MPRHAIFPRLQLPALVRLASLCGALKWAVAAPVLVIALGQNKPPYTTQSPPGGIEYELVSAIVSQMGYRANIVMVPNARAHLMLGSGKVDAAISHDGKIVSEPYIAYQNFAISLAGKALPIKSIADLAPYRVTAFQNAHLFLGPDFAQMSAHNPQYQEVSPQQDANRLLYRDRTDVVISDANLFFYLNRQIAQEVDTQQRVDLNHIFPPTLYRLEFRSAPLRNRFNQALRQVLRSDLYDRLAQKYLAPQDAQGTPYFKPHQP